MKGSSRLDLRIPAVSADFSPRDFYTFSSLLGNQNHHTRDRHHYPHLTNKETEAQKRGVRGQSKIAELPTQCWGSRDLQGGAPTLPLEYHSWLCRACLVHSRPFFLSFFFFFQ